MSKNSRVSGAEAPKGRFANRRGGTGHMSVLRMGPAEVLSKKSPRQGFILSAEISSLYFRYMISSLPGPLEIIVIG